MGTKQITFMDEVLGQVTRLVGPALGDFRKITAQNNEAELLKQLTANYETTPFPVLMRASQALGHSEGENVPCKVCQLMARKEQELMDEDIGEV